MCGTPLVVQPMRGYHLHSTNYSQTETQPRPGSSGSRGGALDLGVIILDRPPSTCGVLHCLNYLHADGQVCSYAEKWEEAVLHIHQVHIQSKKVKKKNTRRVGKHKQHPTCESFVPPWLKNVFHGQILLSWSASEAISFTVSGCPVTHVAKH